MELSIIIPAHNAIETLERCITSLVHQDIEDYEIIIIENGSTDGTAELCWELGKRYSNIVYRSIQESNVSIARNEGLKIAKGYYIGFADADDYYEENVLGKILQMLKGDEFGVLVTSFTTIQTDGNINRWDTKRQDICADKMIPLVINDNRIMGSVWNKFYKRELIGDTQFDISLQYCEDMVFNVNVLYKNREEKCHITNLNTYYYVASDYSVTGDASKFFDSNENLKYIQACKKALLLLEGTQYEKEVRYSIFGYAVVSLHNLIIDQRKKEILISEAKSNFWSFIVLIYKYSWKYNIKKLLWFVQAKFRINCEGNKKE